MTASPRLLVSDLVFPEGPRWHDGRLWLSDMFAAKVIACTPDGTVETILDTGEMWPSGLGFLPDGSLVVATMQDGLLVRWDKGSTSTLADLSSYGDGAQFWGSIINDMVIDGRGNALRRRVRHGHRPRRVRDRPSSSRWIHRGGRRGARARQWHDRHAGWKDVDRRGTRFGPPHRVRHR